MIKVIKRDGREVDFDKIKIKNVILTALYETDKELTDESKNLAEKIANLIETKVESKAKDITVEEIQDEVEKHLMLSKRKDVAKAYILYRNQRSNIRNMNNRMMKNVLEKTNANKIDNINANVDENSFGGRKKEASDIVQKEIALNTLMSKDVAEAHKNGLIYQHDLSEYSVASHNCLNLNFGEIFTNGFKTRNGDVRPPSSLSTACQLVAVAFQCQSQCMFGGVGTVHLDYDLTPFVKISFKKHFKKGLKFVEDYTDEYIERFLKFNDIYLDNEYIKTKHPKAYEYAVAMLDEEGNQSAQGLFHNLNTLESRAGSQVPFSSINFGRDTSAEGRLVSQWMLNASLGGIGRHHLTSIFPISIFQYKQGINASEGDVNYDLKKLAIKSLSKRIYPNFVNCDWTEAHEDKDDIDTFFATMGCRTMLGYDRHGLGYTRVGRGNNVPITIILPKLGIEYGICLDEREVADIEGFNKAFEETLLLTEKALVERFNHMCSQSPKSAPFMYENFTMQGARECEENVYNSLKHNTLAIGYIGVAEMCQALFGKNHSQDEKVFDFALNIVKRINEFAKEASERNDLNFSCYATPAENLCNTALQTLRKQYGIIEDVTDREYLTNSHHIPVWEKVSIAEKLRLEAPFCKYPTGGCITYVELESAVSSNPEAIENIIDYAFKQLDIPYLAINFPIDNCLDCGYQGEFTDKCTECGSENIQQLRRVTGYLTGDYKKNFNKGKIAETEEREKHSKYNMERL